MGPTEPQDAVHPPGTPALQHMSHTSLMVASGMLASTHTSDAPSSTSENSLTYANQDKCYSYTLNLSLQRTCDLGLTGLLTKVVEHNECPLCRSCNLFSVCTTNGLTHSGEMVSSTSMSPTAQWVSPLQSKTTQ